MLSSQNIDFKSILRHFISVSQFSVIPILNQKSVIEKNYLKITVIISFNFRFMSAKTNLSSSPSSGDYLSKRSSFIFTLKLTVITKKYSDSTVIKRVYY